MPPKTLEMPSAEDRWHFPFEGGTTPLPNALFDSLLPTLGDTELRVVLVVARSTLGWKEGQGRKRRDWLSHSQLRKRTGRSGAPVSRAIDSLVKRGLLLVQNEAGEPQESARQRSAARSNLFFCLGESAGGNISALPYPPAAPPTSRADYRNQPEEVTGHATALENKDGGEKEPVSPVFSASNSETEAKTLPATLERRLYFLKTTKETQTKNIKNVSSLLSQVIDEESEVVAASAEEQEPQDQNWEPQVQRFLAIFEEARRAQRPEEEVITVSDEDVALLCDYFARGHENALQKWLPTFFASSFGFVRRRNYSLRAYLDCFFILQAQGH